MRVEFAAGLPAQPFGGERGLPGFFDGSDIGGVVVQEIQMLGHREFADTGAHLEAARRHIGAQVEQFLGRYRIPADPVEEPEQPRFTGFERGALPVTGPDGYGAADELIAAGGFHTVDAQVFAADTHGVGRGPGAGGVVFGSDQAVAGVERDSQRRERVPASLPRADPLTAAGGSGTRTDRAP